VDEIGMQRIKRIAQQELSDFEVWLHDTHSIFFGLQVYSGRITSCNHNHIFVLVYYNPIQISISVTVEFFSVSFCSLIPANITTNHTFKAYNASISAARSD
jgi:hypothetical protein